VGHAAPPRHTADYFALKVLNTVLGGSFTSRLNTILRERMGVTYGARSRFLLRRNGGLFNAGGAVFTAAAARSAEVVVEEMTRLMSERVPPAELQRAQSYIALGVPRSFETTEDIAAHLREQLLYDLGDDYWQSYVDRILAVTADDIVAVAARHLQPDACVIAVVADQDAVRSSLEQTGLGDVVPTRVIT
jgi:zinc protease